jgi:hypothetical protein
MIKRRRQGGCACLRVIVHTAVQRPWTRIWNSTMSSDICAVASTPDSSSTSRVTAISRGSPTWKRAEEQTCIHTWWHT